MPGRRAAGAAMIAVLAASALAACTAPVAVDREKPEDVAHDFLVDEGLL